MADRNIEDRLKIASGTRTNDQLEPGTIEYLKRLYSKDPKAAEELSESGYVIQRPGQPDKMLMEPSIALERDQAVRDAEAEQFQGVSPWRKLSDAIKQNMLDFKERSAQTASDLWQGPQTLLGLATGALKTGEMPTHSMDPQGNREFRFNVPNENPLTMGEVIMSPSGIRPQDLAHERVHTEQSRELGPMYTGARVLGDLMSWIDTGDPYYGHPMEDMAYYRTADTNDLDNYLSMVLALRNANRGRP